MKRNLRNKKDRLNGRGSKNKQFLQEAGPVILNRQALDSNGIVRGPYHQPQKPAQILKNNYIGDEDKENLYLNKAI